MGEMLDQLEDLLVQPGFYLIAEPGMPYIDTLAVYDAPVEQAFRFQVDPTLVRDWMAPASLKTHVVAYGAPSGGPGALYRATPTAGPVCSTASVTR